MTVVVDLDGVVWRGDKPLEGSAQALDRFRNAGGKVVFLTNNSAPTQAENLAKFASQGVRASSEELISSAQAAATLVEPGETALCCAAGGVQEALENRGAKVVEEGEADVVVVGWHRHFDFDRLSAATTALLGGARLVGTNDDATYPTSGGLLPGGGSLLAAVEYASGKKAVVAGKPHEPVVRLLKQRISDVEMVIGDRPSTDGLLAQRLGVKFALVRTGVIAPGAEFEGETPDIDEFNLAAVINRILGP